MVQCRGIVLTAIIYGQHLLQSYRKACWKCRSTGPWPCYLGETSAVSELPGPACGVPLGGKGLSANCWTLLTYEGYEHTDDFLVSAISKNVCLRMQADLHL